MQRKGLGLPSVGESHISIVTRADHPILQAQETVPVEDRMTDYPYVIAENHENFGRFYDDDS